MVILNIPFESLFCGKLHLFKTLFVLGDIAFLRVPYPSSDRRPQYQGPYPPEFVQISTHSKSERSETLGSISQF